ncbi:MAG: hypothetical protein Q7U57_18300 [Methylovulum sp.]|nr:hypothetical protein [Methylovulum sp.]
MDSDYDIFEIVAVIREFWLIDAESYQRHYCTEHGRCLAAGYYVVNWPEHIRARRFNEQATFHGPFCARKEAQAALERMRQERERRVAVPVNTAPVAAPTICRLNARKSSSQNVRSLKAGAAGQAVVAGRIHG